MVSWLTLALGSLFGAPAPR